MTDIPVLTARGIGIAESYENALIALYKDGIEIETQYDKEGDLPSIDATMNITIKNPLSEPMIHKAFPGGIEDLREYLMELEGHKNHWVKNLNDPEDTRWEYTYNQRLTEWGTWKESNKTVGIGINQVKQVIKKLSNQPFSRQAQMITWMPQMDADVYDPPCFVGNTMILTPYGEKEIKDLKNKDVVYAVDINNGKLYKDFVKNFFRKKNKPIIRLKNNITEIECSEEQLIYTDKGWKKAKDIGKNDVIRISSSFEGSITEEMVVGFMHGDGWLTNGYNKSRAKPIKRYDVCFSIHPDSDDNWIINYISKYSQNKILTEERNVCSKTVVNGGISKKISVHDKQLWENLKSKKCPVGPKKDLKIEYSLEGKSREEIIHFLIGIYSAEGCIYFGKHPSIQIGMKWKDCIDLIKEILCKLEIKYTYFNYNDVYSIYIDSFENICKFINLVDFRLDSRKQSKFLALKYLINESSKKLNNKTRRLWEKLDKRIKTEKNSVYLPVEVSVEENKDVYDFEIEHKDHAIITNKIISHNCLQSIHFRLLEDRDEYYLNTNIRFRSNDAWNANFMNMFGLIFFIKNNIMDKLAEKLNKPVHMARVNWQADSYHIYGKDRKAFKERFINRLTSTTFEDRTYRFDDSIIQDIWNDSKKEIIKKIKLYDETH